MTKTFLPYCFSFFCAATLSAQESDTLNLDYEFYKRSAKWDIAVGLRSNHHNFDDMNNMLRQAELPALKTSAFGSMVAFRASSDKSRWECEASFDFLRTDSNNRAINGTAVVYQDFSAYIRALYNLAYRNSMTKLYPFLGVGGAYRSLRTYSEIPGNGSFVMTINQNVQRYKFHCNSIPLEVGIGLEQGFKGKRNDVFVGVRGGYSYNVLWSEWALDGDILTDLARPNSGAPFWAVFVRFKAAPQRAWEAKKEKIPAQD